MICGIRLQLPTTCTCDMRYEVAHVICGMRYETCDMWYEAAPTNYVHM